MNEKIDELFDVMGLENILADLEGQAKIPGSDDLYSKFIESYLATTVRDRIIKEIKQLFCTLLTEEEVDGLLEFYKSNAGQALLKKMPILNREAAYLGQKLTSEMMSDETLDEKFEAWKRITEEESREKVLH